MTHIAYYFELAQAMRDRTNSLTDGKALKTNGK